MALLDNLPIETNSRTDARKPRNPYLIGAMRGGGIFAPPSIEPPPRNPKTMQGGATAKRVAALFDAEGTPCQHAGVPCAVGWHSCVLHDRPTDTIVNHITPLQAELYVTLWLLQKVRTPDTIHPCALSMGMAQCGQ